jgi:peptidoglycan/xylan/chitin deacetylase (PgdA/CDA1 family)
VTNLRLDRFVSVHLAQPARQMFGGMHQSRIPILMYHSIEEGSSDPRPYYDINTTPTRFEQQLKLLSEEGYRTIHLDDAVRALTQDTGSSKWVVITFDDGYRNFATAAYPILSKFGFTAELFVPSDLIQDHPAEFLGRPLLTWSDLRELQRNGIEVGSHSASHGRLKLLGDAELEKEVAQSKNAIEDKTGRPVTSFSYPYAFPETDLVFAKTLRGLLSKHGYETGVTTVLGTAGRSSDSLLLPRLPVNSSDDLTLFRAKLAGSYNWLHAFQYMTKKLKQLRHQPSRSTSTAETGRI